jgi:dTDP-4-amino-4,6-dideoxygalactose transaminase
MIPVTRPFLPPLGDYHRLLDEVWESQWLTNFGAKHRALEQALAQDAGIDAVFVSSGTTALQLAVRGLDLRGDVLTTPFSFIATTTAIAWSHCTPRFVDIDPETLNIDPAALEAALTPSTTAILATHTYGNPCDDDALVAFARAHGLRLVYDAAHAFGVTWRGRSLFARGDVSIASLHATKLFHTVEGGVVYTSDATLTERFRRLRDFGGQQEPRWTVPGINAKNSELHAAMGLAILPYLPQILEVRRAQGLRYREHLAGVVRFQRIALDTQYTHAFVPVLFPNEATTIAAQTALREADIEARRYFWPLLSDAPWAEPAHTPVAADVARTVLCLPIFHTLADADIDRICEIVVRAAGGARTL